MTLLLTEDDVRVLLDMPTARYGRRQEVASPATTRKACSPGIASTSGRPASTRAPDPRAQKPSRRIVVEYQFRFPIVIVAVSY